MNLYVRGRDFAPFNDFDVILKLFRQCDISLFLFDNSLFNIINKKRKCMTKETFSAISFTMLVKASTPFIIKVDLK